MPGAGWEEFMVFSTRRFSELHTALELSRGGSDTYRYTRSHKSYGGGKVEDESSVNHGFCGLPQTLTVSLLLYPRNPLVTLWHPDGPVCVVEGGRRYPRMNTTMTTPIESRHSGGMDEVPDPQVPPKACRRRYSAKYKAEILAEYRECGPRRQRRVAAPGGLVYLADQRLARPARPRSQRGTGSLRGRGTGHSSPEGSLSVAEGK